MINFFKTLSKFFGVDMFEMTYTIRTPKEKLIWESIEKKAKQGLKEFYYKCDENSNYWSWPWMSPNLTKEERDFVNNLHHKFFGNDYIVDPIGGSQADYMWYKDIKDKIIL